jgi:hypothetical protein
MPMLTMSFVAARVRVRIYRKRAAARSARNHEWNIDQRREHLIDVRGSLTGGSRDFPLLVLPGRSRSPPPPAALSAAVRSIPRRQRSDVLERKHPMRAMDVMGPAGRARFHAGPLPFRSAASDSSAPSAMDRSRFARSGSGRFDRRVLAVGTLKGDAGPCGSTFGSHPRHRQAWQRNGRRPVSRPRQCSKTLWDLDRPSLSDPHLGQHKTIGSLHAAAMSAYDTRAALRRAFSIWS